MRRSLRTLLKIVGMAVPALQTGTTLAAEVPSSQTPRIVEPGVTTLVTRLAGDPILRARFAANPQAVLREWGVDATLYGSPDRLAEADIARVLATWVGPSGPPVGSEATNDLMRVSDIFPRIAPTAVIYGPPPTPLPDMQKPPPAPRPHEGPAPAPAPAPVYGPPAGHPKL